MLHLFPCVPPFWRHVLEDFGRGWAELVHFAACFLFGECAVFLCFTRAGWHLLHTGASNDGAFVIADVGKWQVQVGILVGAIVIADVVAWQVQVGILVGASTMLPLIPSAISFWMHVQEDFGWGWAGLVHFAPRFLLDGCVVFFCFKGTKWSLLSAGTAICAPLCGEFEIVDTDNTSLFLWDFWFPWLVLLELPPEFFARLIPCESTISCTITITITATNRTPLIFGKVVWVPLSCYESSVLSWFLLNELLMTWFHYRHQFKINPAFNYWTLPLETCSQQLRSILYQHYSMQPPLTLKSIVNTVGISVSLMSILLPGTESAVHLHISTLFEKSIRWDLRFFMDFFTAAGGVRWPRIRWDVLGSNQSQQDDTEMKWNEKTVDVRDSIRDDADEIRSISDLESGIDLLGVGCGIDPRSQIPDPRSQIPDPRSQIPDPRSAMKTNSWSPNLDFLEVRNDFRVSNSLEFSLMR